jgi:microcystin degradation protein MlrC
MRIFAAGLQTETNTFAPWPTGLADFRLRRDSSELENGDLNGAVARLFRDSARADGHEFIEGLFGFAEPSGPTVHGAFEVIRDEILHDLRRSGPFDAVLLFLHGAMVSTECLDCEGDIITRVREIVGRTCVIGVELDLHCHITDAMVCGADVIVLMKEYPHDDILDRAREVYTLCMRAAARSIRPTTAVFDCRMIGFYPTTLEPMASLVTLMRELEQHERVLSVSFAHGFPWGDTPETGSKVLVITDDDPTTAEWLAQEFARQILAKRHLLLPRYPTIEAALDLATAAGGRIVLADTADNAGGGAPSDNVSFLRAILERGLTGVATGCYWDPIAAQVCASAGVGARIQLRLGGKCGKASGDPIDLTVVVRSICPSFEQPALSGSIEPLGLSVWVETQGVDIVITSVRSQVFSPQAFMGLGIDLEGKRFIVVKSSQHFYNGFAPLADRIVHVATPGALQMNFAEIAYRHRRDLNFFPRVASPFEI